MANIASRCQEVARQTAKRVYGESCVYLADGQAVEITAIPTKPRAMLNGEQVVVVDADALDFLIEASELTRIAGLTEPAEGHQVLRWKETIEETYEVRPPGPELRCFEPVDAHGALYRVHAKRITSE